MGSVGDCYDNALCESFLTPRSSCELLNRVTFATPAEAVRAAVFDFIGRVVQQCNGAIPHSATSRR